MTEAAPHILIVEDDEEISSLLKENLSAIGFDAVAVNNGSELFSNLQKRVPDLILLDIMLPGEDGLRLCRKLKAQGSATELTPLIFVSALGELTDRVVGLEIGADDYLAKPFEMRELVARIRALLRRTAATRSVLSEKTQAMDGTQILRFGKWRLNTDSHALIDENDVVVTLSSLEFKLLTVFLNNPQRVLSREALMNHLDSRPDSFDRSIDVQISRLRAKLHDNARSPKLIQTMRGDGYMFAETAVRESA